MTSSLLRKLRSHDLESEPVSFELSCSNVISHEDLMWIYVQGSINVYCGMRLYTQQMGVRVHSHRDKASWMKYLVTFITQTYHQSSRSHCGVKNEYNEGGSI